MKQTIWIHFHLCFVSLQLPIADYEKLDIQQKQCVNPLLTVNNSFTFASAVIGYFYHVVEIRLRIRKGNDLQKKKKNYIAIIGLQTSRFL